MEDKAIVLVTDYDDNKHGEISVMDDREKARRLVESLLEAGFEQERIRVFTGGEMRPQVSHRPVVALVDDGSDPAEGEAQEAGASVEGVQSLGPLPKRRTAVA